MPFMLTCKEAHQLTSEGMDRGLSAGERMRMRVHLAVCTACRNFDSQMQLIRRSMRELEVDGEDKETR
jgi:predicted anti-sigma-YlaC factor YlaD